MVIADSVLINGGIPLKGQVSIQGSKNAALPILAASLLFNDEIYLHNVPDLLDIRSMLEILEYLGVQYIFKNGTAYLNCKNIINKRIPVEFSKKLRASSLIMGPLLARFGSAEVGMPGGCNIGPRPLNYHFSGFEDLGAKVLVEDGLITINAGEKLEGEHTLEFPSVGATENLITASVFSGRKVILKNIAKEPEIIDLINFLTKAGAKIAFTDVTTLEIEGITSLGSNEYRVRPDRIEAGTFLIAGFATKGNVRLVGVEPDDLGFVLHKLEEMGAHISVERDTIAIAYKGEIKATNIKTTIFPGFPTDLQSPITVLMTQATRNSTVVENIFDNRYQHIPELIKMNAKIEMQDKTATLCPSNLVGAKVDSFDLRGAAAMIIAGLCASGTTRVSGLKHLFRGYESFVEKLEFLGADICYA